MSKCAVVCEVCRGVEVSRCRGVTCYWTRSLFVCVYIEHVIEHVRCLYASTIDATYLLHTCTMVYNIVYIPAPAALCFSLHPFNSHLSIKLFRFLRIGRMMKRWEQRLDIKYSHMAIFKFAFLIIFVCHWLACFWMIAAHLSPEPTRTWCVYRLFLLKWFIGCW